jgi:hypothetical protein
MTDKRKGPRNEAANDQRRTTNDCSSRETMNPHSTSKIFLALALAINIAASPL